MNTKLLFASVTMLSASLYAASALVWNADGSKADMSPAGWEAIEVGDGAVDKLDPGADGSKAYALFVNDYEESKDVAGFWFAWNRDEKKTSLPVSLADYKGLCVSYKSDAPFRVSFNQSTVTDGDFYGTLFNASKEMESVFIDFSKISQEGTGKKVAFDAKSQLDVRFTFTSAMAVAAGLKKNVITLYEISLGDRCTNNAPSILSPYDEKTEVTVKEDEKLSIDLSKVFEDKDGDALTITVTSTDKNNVLSLSNKGDSFKLTDVLEFVPAKNTNGTAVVNISASDGIDNVDYIFTVNVVDIENLPTAVADKYETKEDVALTVTAAKGVLANDSDLDGDKIQAGLVKEPAHGTLKLAADGSFTYTPAANFNGTDSWTYEVSDGKKHEEKFNTATVTITVKPVNDKPTVTVKDSTFLKDTLSLVENFVSDEASTITISKKDLVFDDIDGDELSFGAKGTNIAATVKATEDSYIVTLSPIKDIKVGIASVLLYAADAESSVGVTLYVKITAAPKPPVAVSDVYMTNLEEILIVTAEDGVLANDKRLDDPTAKITASDVIKSGLGGVILNADGSFEYLPPSGFVGIDTFTYQAVSDGLLSEEMTVYINVAPVVAPKALVWDSTDNNALRHPYKPVDWYTYPDSFKDSLTTDKETGVKTFSARVELSKDDDASGFGFAWKLGPDPEDETKRIYVPMSIADYKGLCITYSATYPFRVDLVQSTITDYDYYGMIIPEKGRFTTAFVDFNKIAQEGWGDIVPLDLEKQVSVQFSYKTTIGKDNGPMNTISISSIKLANSCEGNREPGIFAPYNKEGSEKLLESDTLYYDLSKMFYDEDGDSLKITAGVSGKYLKLTNQGTSFSRFDVLKFVPVPNSSGTAIVSISATDGISEKKLSYRATVEVEDQQNPPFAVNDEYTVDEDATLKVTAADGVLKNDYDLDGDAFIAKRMTNPESGTLTFSEDGSFTYKPAKDFNGDVSFTYSVVDKKNAKDVGNTATVTIHVKPVNDKPVVVVNDSSFVKDTLVLDEDFEPGANASILVPIKSITFSDVDGDETLSIGVKGTGINATLETSATLYSIDLTPVKDYNGIATVLLYATDKVDTVGVKIYVKLNPVLDPPIGVPDVYTAFSDSTLNVSAKDGVLKNDSQPDDTTAKITAVIGEAPSNGTLTLNADGSFSYKSNPGFVGPDYFAYYAVSGTMKSNPVMVTINVEKCNFRPVVIADVAKLDTTVSEDFKTILKYSKDLVTSWFKDPEGDPLTYSVSSKDGKLNPTLSAAGVLTIESVPDSNGNAYVTVTAIDAKSGSTSFDIHVTITPVNDMPVILHADTAYVGVTNEWSVSWDLDTLVKDIDGDKLLYTPNMTTTLNKFVEVKISKSILTMKSRKNIEYKENQLFALGVTASDGSAEVKLPIAVVVGKAPVSLQPVLASGSLGSWKDAVKASHGSVALMDMQGRVMWSAKLPISEAEVYNASARVQGRKVLRINKQVWTIR